MDIIKNKQGVTLLELTVAVAIFTTTMIMAIGVFKSVIEGQRSAIAAQNTQESMRYAFEMMSKEIRQARKSTSSCETIIGSLGFPATTAQYKVYNTAVSDSILYLKNRDKECTAYYLEIDANGVSRLTIFRDDITDGFDDISYYITPDEIKISNLEFTVTDDIIESPHRIQPRVTIKMGVEMAKGKTMHKQPMVMQTTVSSRFYE